MQRSSNILHQVQTSSRLHGASSHHEMHTNVLEGAALYILDEDTNQNVTEYVLGMGGRVVTDIRDATHAVLVKEPASVSPQLESAIVTAQACSVPLVLVGPWLQRCAGLASGHHWSDISVTDLVPLAVQKLGDMCAVTTRRDHRDSLSRSITQTFQFLKQEDPDLVEENSLKRAMELSLLDCALVVSTTACTPSAYASSQQPTESPHQVLGLKSNATCLQIKAAYRKLALRTHPDKGGTEEAFQKVALAYRSILASLSAIAVTDKIHKPKHLKTTAHWDSELADHRRLVEALFASHGANLEVAVSAQQNVLQYGLKLQPQSAGSTNVNEREELIHNSCFYLSLAASYLSGIGALMLDDDLKKVDEDLASSSVFGEEDRFLIGETALQLKRRIEAAVVSAHPEWAASGMVGEEVQAFSDFLVYLLDCPHTIISEWAVVVFDTTSGMCDIYKGTYYDSRPHGHSSNCITIQYMPGHYEPLLPIFPEQRPTLQQILDVMEANGVMYIITDGAA